jgi:D-glycero-D-manno-heptose 1,7-bisphosphate phosphatase
VTRRAVFLDRDGVLNRTGVKDGKPYPPGDVSELEVLPGVEKALDSLRRAGFALVVVTNQPDVARGIQTIERLTAINNRLRSLLALDALYVCCHDDRDRCECRKPAPGMLLAAAREFGVDLAASFMVGDRWRDIEAGRRAGCRTILVDYGYDEDKDMKPDWRVVSLAEAARVILGQAEGGAGR